MTWAEDRATQRCDPSADPGAETGAGAKLRFAPLPSPRSGIGAKAINLRGRMPRPFSAGCLSPLANARRLTFQFTVNQYIRAD